ncbi:Histidine--tRNA ligase [compost metagenome]
MKKINKISGFPEYSPYIRSIELDYINKIKSSFALHGFTDIETPAVELIETLSSKGEDVDKEIYSLSRLADNSNNDSSGKFALHYDLTVPLARYVSQHFNDLDFPFRRSQIQKVWRGERPQEGRYREFLQCDIDIIGSENLSIDSDYQVIAAALDAMRKLDIGKVGLKLNSRKILEGAYSCIGVGNIDEVIRIMDKINKVSKAELQDMLIKHGLDSQVTEKCIKFAEISTSNGEILESLISNVVSSNNDLLNEGLQETINLMNRLQSKFGKYFDIQADMSIARGFDYYTGMICEGYFLDYPAYPSICAGGRYDNLVSNFSNKKLPGVGMSIGFTRIFTKMLAENLLPQGSKNPAKVMIARYPETKFEDLENLADLLRNENISTIVHYEDSKLTKQLRYASKIQIPYVILVSDSSDVIELKDMNTGAQEIIKAENLIQSLVGKNESR